MKRLFAVVVSVLFMLLLIGCAEDQVLPENEKEFSVENNPEVNRSLLEKERLHNTSTYNVKQTQEIVKDEAEEIEEESKETEKTALKNNNASETPSQSEKTGKSDNKDLAVNESHSNVEKASKQSEKKNDNEKVAEKPTDTKQEEKTEEEPAENIEEKPKNEEKKEEPQAPTSTVTVSITTGDVKGTILSSTQVQVEEGDTVLDATRKILNQKGIQISVRGSGGTAYVEGIDNLYEFDEGPLSGWLVHVNGIEIDRSAGAYPVQSGQVIRWIYTTNFMEETGG